MKNKSENKRRVNNKYYYSEKNHEYLKKEARERYHKDSEYKRATLERAKKRYYEDAEYKKATIGRAIQRYRKNKLKKILEKQLSNTILQNGIILLPKGKEITLVAKSKIKSVQLNTLLKNSGFIVKRPYQNENKFYHPINGKDLEEKLQKILSV